MNMLALDTAIHHCGPERKSIIARDQTGCESHDGTDNNVVGRVRACNFRYLHWQLFLLVVYTCLSGQTKAVSCEFAATNSVEDGVYLVRKVADVPLRVHAMVDEILDGEPSVSNSSRYMVVERFHIRLDRFPSTAWSTVGLVVVQVRHAPFETWMGLGELVERALVGGHGVFVGVELEEGKGSGLVKALSPLIVGSGESPGVGRVHLFHGETLFLLSNKENTCRRPSLHIHVLTKALSGKGGFPSQ